MKKRFLALLAAGTLLLTGCGAQGAANSNAEAGGDGGAEDNLHHLTVVLDWYPNALHAFLYEAQEKGYFAEQGLDVDIQSPAGVNDAMSMVAAGKADIGLYYQQDVIQARAEQNVPIKSIGAVVQGPLISCSRSRIKISPLRRIWRARRSVMPVRSFLRP